MDAGIWQFSDYYVYEPTITLSWLPAATGIPECGNVIWNLGMVDSKPIDSSIFTQDFSLATKTLDIYSTDVTKARSYDFLVTVYYDV